MKRRRKGGSDTAAQKTLSAELVRPTYLNRSILSRCICAAVPEPPYPRRRQNLLGIPLPQRRQDDPKAADLGVGERTGRVSPHVSSLDDIAIDVSGYRHLTWPAGNGDDIADGVRTIVRVEMCGHDSL